MPAYNAEKTIVDSVGSVLEQTYGNWELIVVDDGSRDDTSRRVETAFSDPRIRLFRQENAGVAAARNAGMSRARGDLIAFLDSDDLWTPDKLEKQTAVFARDAEGSVGMCFTGVRRFSQRPEESVPLYAADMPTGENLCEGMLVANPVALLSVMVRASVLREVGAFDPSLFGTEDWDLWIRICRRAKIVFLPEELAYYRDHPGGISKDLNRHLDEKYKVLQKHVIGRADVNPSVRKEALWRHEIERAVFLAASGRRREAAVFAWKAFVRYPGRRRSLAALYRAVTAAAERG